MQGLSSKPLKSFAGLRGQTGGFGSKAGPIGVIAQQRVADGGQMNADLVRTPGHQPAGQQAGDRGSIGTGEALQDLPVSYGRAAVWTHRHFVAGTRMAAE